MSDTFPKALRVQIDAISTEIKRQEVVKRIWEIDHTVWKPEPDEIHNRLGWLISSENMRRNIPRIKQFVDAVRSAGYTRALLLGMGGSSLAPEVFRDIFGVETGYLDLVVLDSTDPDAVRNSEAKLTLSKTLFIVATKSGTTVETLSGFKYFYNKILAQYGRQEAGKHFIAITDAGSSLEQMAHDLDFRDCFLNDPNIGGRFAALSYFGLVPAALVGIDLELLLQRAGAMVSRCKTPEGSNPGAWLGTVMAAAYELGRDKLTLIASPEIAHFGAWAEQLIAESTGKEKKAFCPVDAEEPGAAEVYADDRLFVYSKLAGDNTHQAVVSELQAAGFPVIHLELRDVYDLGAEFFRWEFATAIVGYRLQINPFDQPDVESAKNAARAVVAEFQQKGVLPVQQPAFVAGGIEVYADLEAASIAEALQMLFSDPLSSGATASYVALQAFLTPAPETDQALADLRLTIRTRRKLAVTVGYGPRFLHSTGQLHKGDAGSGLFMQFTADSAEDIAIPDKPGDNASSISFGVLKSAQALGDNHALVAKGRKIIRFHFTGDVVQGIQQITNSIV